MTQLFTFLFHTLPLIIAWFYLITALIFVFLYIKSLTNKIKLTLLHWIYLVFNIGYSLFFLITRFFFYGLWEDAFTIAGVTAIIISCIWSRYIDKVSGKRWWNW